MAGLHGNGNQNEAFALGNYMPLRDWLETKAEALNYVDEADREDLWLKAIEPAIKRIARGLLPRALENELWRGNPNRKWSERIFIDKNDKPIILDTEDGRGQPIKFPLGYSYEIQLSLIGLNGLLWEMINYPFQYSNKEKPREDHLSPELRDFMDTLSSIPNAGAIATYVRAGYHPYLSTEEETLKFYKEGMYDFFWGGNTSYRVFTGPFSDHVDHEWKNKVPLGAMKRTLDFKQSEMRRPEETYKEPIHIVKYIRNLFVHHNHNLKRGERRKDPSEILAMISQTFPGVQLALYKAVMTILIDEEGRYSREDRKMLRDQLGWSEIDLEAIDEEKRRSARTGSMDAPRSSQQRTVLQGSSSSRGVTPQNWER